MLFSYILLFTYDYNELKPILKKIFLFFADLGKLTYNVQYNSLLVNYFLERDCIYIGEVNKTKY